MTVMPQSIAWFRIYSLSLALVYVARIARGAFVLTVDTAQTAGTGLRNGSHLHRHDEHALSPLLHSAPHLSTKRTGQRLVRSKTTLRESQFPLNIVLNLFPF